MRSSLLLLAALLACGLAFAGEPAVTEETVAALLKDMGDRPDNFRLTPEQTASLVLVKGKAGSGLGALVKLEGRTFLCLSSRLLAGNSGVTFQDLGGGKHSPASMECSADGCLLKIGLKEAAAQGFATGLPVAGETMLLFGGLEKEDSLSFYEARCAGLAQGRVAVKEEFPLACSGAAAFTAGRDYVGVLERRAVKNVPDFTTTTNCHVYAARSYISRADEAGWEKAGKGFLGECAAVGRHYDLVQEAVMVVQAWSNGGIFMTFADPARLPETCRSFAEEHNALHAKLVEEVGMDNGNFKLTQKSAKEIVSALKKDGNALKGYLRKCLEGAPAAASIKQPALQRRMREAEELQRELIKSVEAAVERNTLRYKQ